MKIAFVSDVIYPFVKGGAEKRIYELSKRLAKRGHDVHIFGMKYWTGRNVIKQDSVIIHGVCFPFSLYVKNRRSIRQAIVFSFFLFPHLLKEKFDVIDCSEFPYIPCFVAKLASVFRRVPLIVSWYEIWGNYWYEYLGKLGLAGKLVEKLTSFLANRNIAITNQTKRNLTSLGVMAKNISVVPLGIDIRGIQNTSHNGTNFDILYVGRLIKEKNVDVLLKAVALLNKGHPNLRVGIIGDGPEKFALKKLTTLLHISKSVQFFGSVENYADVLSTMKASKLMVNLSSREGGGSLVALEASACGVPFVANRDELGISDELVKDDYNGYYVNSLTEKEVAKKIDFLLTNDVLREYIGKNGVEFSKNFDWEKITTILENIYYSLQHRKT